MPKKIRLRSQLATARCWYRWSDAGTVDEGEDAVFTVNLSGQVSEELVVRYRTEHGTTEE